MLNSVREPLKSKSFRLVWSGESLSSLGDSAFQVVFAWLVLKHFGAAVLGAVMLAQAIPRGVLMLVGGAFTDRLSPRVVMMMTHVTRGLAVAALGLLDMAGSVRAWQFFAFAIIVGAAEAFFWPASGAVVPALVPEEHLPRALGLVTVSEQVAMLAGPALGGVAVAAIGTSASCLVDAATFGIALLTLIPARSAVPPEEPERVSLSALKNEISSGLGYAFRSRDVRIVLMMISAAALSYSGLFSVGLPALARTYSYSATALGLLVSAWGLGQLCGALGASITGLPRRWGMLIIGMTLCEGSAFALLGFVPRAWTAAAVLALVGVGVAYSTDVALPLFVQTRTPRELLGRVNSVLNLPRMVFEPVSMGMMGLLVSVGVRWGFVAAAVPMLAVGLRLAFDPQARTLRLRDDGRHEDAAEASLTSSG
jgi:MFS family permease